MLVHLLAICALINARALPFGASLNSEPPPAVREASNFLKPFFDLPTVGHYGGCTDGITCSLIKANNLTFQCRFAKPAGGAPSKGNVMMLHGFPEWSDMYMPLMRAFATKGYASAACNQRGYSPGAKPDDEKAYNYDVLRSDIFAVATAVGFTNFHLVGHDHGGVLGWAAAASDEGKTRLLSYSSLSIPHVDAFSSGLYGPSADIEQQIASQYFTMFVLPNSASLHWEFWYNTMGRTSGDSNSGSFSSAQDFQKALWWYNGAADAGVMAFPPLMSATSLLEHGTTTSIAMASLRGIFGGTPNNGSPAAHPIGNVSVPSLYVCGKSDGAILCNREYAKARTPNYIAPGTAYTYIEVDCGHEVLSCSSKAETAKVVAAIIGHVEAAHGRDPVKS